MSPYSAAANAIVRRRCRRRFASYKGRGISDRALRGWFDLFASKAHYLARRFLLSVIYVDSNRLQQDLITKGNGLMNRLQDDGILAETVLVVQVDSLGSSAARAVTTFRRNAPGGRDCVYVQAADGYLSPEDKRRLIILSGSDMIRAVVYVDDFVGTGTQLRNARGAVIACFGRPLPEFVIAGVVLEETHRDLELECAIEAILVHRQKDRPLLPVCPRYSHVERTMLISLSATLGGQALGFGQCASMVVLSDDVPDNTPSLIREGLFLSA